MTLSIIVAMAKNGVIGKSGGLPWYLPAELAYFKKVTTGHPIIMGRKTHESIGRALPDRKNIVITHDKDYKAKGCVVVDSLESAVKAAKGAEEAFIIGGESIYKLALPKADKLYLTKIDADIDGDRFFRYDTSEWKQVWSEKHAKDEKNPYDFEFTMLERV
jgi:dihydrofolate reductase